MKGMDTRFDVDLSKPNPSHKAIVKGKKVLARLRASQAKLGSAVGEANNDTLHLAIISHEKTSHNASASRSNNGGQQAGFTPQFQFTTGQYLEVGHHFRGSGCRDSGNGARRS